MKPPKRNQRLKILALSGLGVLAGMAVLFSILGDNTQFFYDPSEVTAVDFVPASEKIRIGGMVIEGSVANDGNIETRFSVKDFEGPSQSILPVTYSGILPDLFREGQGVVITGQLLENGEFIASEVLAKHDENYQPKT